MLPENFNFEEIFLKYRTAILILLLGFIVAALGVIYFKTGLFTPSTKVEILENATGGEDQTSKKPIVVEIAGQVEKPGVYDFQNGARVDELLTIAGGFSANADREWANKYLNRASKLVDGQKIYIPKVGETFGSTQVKQSGSSSANKSGGIKVDQPILGVTLTSLVNVNTASLSELDSLPGIGQVYAQNIIDHRPYSTSEELVSKGAIRISLLEKIKNLITVY